MPNYLVAKINFSDFYAFSLSLVYILASLNEKFEQKTLLLLK